MVATKLNFLQYTYRFRIKHKTLYSQTFPGPHFGSWTTRPHWLNDLTLQCHHNGHDGVSNHQPHDCLLNRLFRRRSKKTPKLRVTGLCAGNSPGTDEFPAQMASNAENVSIWWRHHVTPEPVSCIYTELRLRTFQGIFGWRKNWWNVNFWGLFCADVGSRR